MQAVKLDGERHHRAAFDCGNEALNNFLQTTANQLSKRDQARTYVLENPENHSQIIGFYTIKLIQLDFASLPTKWQKKYQQVESVGFIARLGVDKQFQQQGYGGVLLADALRRLLNASETVGFPMILVDAKQGKKAFYQKYGFSETQADSDRLFLTIETLRMALSEAIE